MRQIYILSGLPASGKSTTAKELGGYNICPDYIRGQLTGDEGDQSQNDKVWAIAYGKLKRTLADPKYGRIVFDATNLVASDRHRLLKTIKNSGAEIETILVFHDVPLEVAIERNSKRSRVVPEYRIREMYAEMRLPTESEGFDKIIWKR